MTSHAERREAIERELSDGMALYYSVPAATNEGQRWWWFRRVRVIGENVGNMIDPHFRGVVWWVISHLRRVVSKPVYGALTIKRTLFRQFNDQLGKRPRKADQEGIV